MMDAGRWELVKRLFEAALGHAAGDRAAFVQTACGADSELRREVESLLAAHADAGRFAEQPLVPVTSASVAIDGVPRGEQTRFHPGARIGAYEIRGLVASGGMGDVYRAHDLQLRRDVALKILPASFAADPDRVARFEREARLLAALNHPHIAAIYGFEQQTDVASGSPTTQALVLEFVEGPTLAERLAKSALPIKEALEIAGQIAEALEAAHAKGIIHRDLKPANVKVTPDGTVKVLDFGLAKAFSGDGQGLDLSELPALAVNQTHEGLIAGTPAYMSPEQARGQAVDKRTDIFAFGCVLYEMLTGRPAFPGDTMSDRIAAVLKYEPQWDALPHTVPPAMRKLLRRCLAKDRRQRLSDATDVRLEIEDAQSAPADELRAAPRPRSSWRRPAIAASATALTVSLGVGLAVWFMPRPAPSVSRFVIPLSTGDIFQYSGRHLVAFAPDGGQVVYQANHGLYLRRLDQLQARLIPGTVEGGVRSPGSPVFSPDGQMLGFWAAGELRRIGVNGGAPVALCKADNPWGVSWEANGSILFGQGPRGIWRVADTGGTPELLISIEAGAEAHGPQLLPGGEWVLFTLRGKGIASWDAAQIVAQSLETGERRVLVDRGRDARYVATGHLIYAMDGVLLAVPFNVENVRVTGGAVSLIEGIQDAIPADITGAVYFSVARNGSLIYAPRTVATGADRRLVWIDRQGREEPINTPPDRYLYPRISPDGMRVAIDVLGPTNRDIWIWDLARQTRTRFTFDAGLDFYPVWTPDGQHVLWGWSPPSTGASNLFWHAADGTGAVERLMESPISLTPYGFSPDGKQLLLREEESGFAETLSLLALDGDRRITRLIRTAFNHRNGEISPDGRWLAYESDESGRQEIYVRPFPDIDRGRWQVSTTGGQRPAWARNGQELFYQDLDGALLVVPVTVDAGSFRARSPTRLVEGRYFMGSPATSGRTYDVSPDGRRFLMIKNAPDAEAPTLPHFVVVLNWTEELKRLVPTN